MTESRVMEMLIKMYQDFNNHFNVSCHRRCWKSPHPHFFLKLKQGKKIREDETTLWKHNIKRSEAFKIQEVKTFNKFPTKPQTSLVLLEP